MGFWSSLKNTFKKVLKKVWQVVKAAVRFVVRIVVTVWGLIVGLPDLLLGFLTWPKKYLRYHVFILSDEKGPLIDPAELAASIDFLTQTFKDRLNVKVLSYVKVGIEIIKVQAPTAALDVRCGWGMFKDEFGDAGEFFAQHTAGWNAIPVSLTFPITIFVVRNIENEGGCSFGPLTDYVVITPDGVHSVNTLAHETGHACNLIWHSGKKSNLMFHDTQRGNNLNWFQKNLVRSSRHVQYA